MKTNLHQGNKNFQQPQNQFIEMFLPNNDSYKVVDEKEDADICFYSVQLEDESLLRVSMTTILYKK